MISDPSGSTSPNLDHSQKNNVVGYHLPSSCSLVHILSLVPSPDFNWVRVLLPQLSKYSYLGCTELVESFQAGEL